MWWDSLVIVLRLFLVMLKLIFICFKSDLVIIWLILLFLISSICEVEFLFWVVIFVISVLLFICCCLMYFLLVSELNKFDWVKGLKMIFLVFKVCLFCILVKFIGVIKICLYCLVLKCLIKICCCFLVVLV